MKTLLNYETAPAGSPDKLRLTQPTTFFWENPPEWVVALARRHFNAANGTLWYSDSDRTVRLFIRAGFFFAVSVAPNADEAESGAAVHDWIYEHSEMMASEWKVSERKVLKFADHWFLALMRHEKFAFSSAYFLGVSVFGYAFHTLSVWINSRFGSKK